MEKLTGVFIICICVLVIAGCLSVVWEKHRKETSGQQEEIVAINEIRNLTAQGDTEAAVRKSDELIQSLQKSNGGNQASTHTEYENGDIVRVLLPYGIALIFIAVVFWYVYQNILSPFSKMKDYAEAIARGDFNRELTYERSNYFGDFTWAFDSMRREILRSREAEQAAADKNKLIIATLSHDIKTPIASIRAYAEAFEAGLDTVSLEKRRKYLSVMMAKCDDVTRLTNDLLLHSVSELHQLSVECERIDVAEFLKSVTGELAVDGAESADGAEVVDGAETSDGAESADGVKTVDGAATEENREAVLHISEGTQAVIFADRKRLMQVMENLVNNSKKYAKTRIDISLEASGGKVRILVRDYGDGIPDEDMPFIFQKFYRGHNTGVEQGSGLGLYISKELVERMEGELTLENKDPGLLVTLEFAEKSNI